MKGLLCLTLAAVFGSALTAGAAQSGPAPLPEPRLFGTLKARHPKMGISALAFSPDAKSLAVAARDGEIYVWGIETGKNVRLPGHLPDIKKGETNLPLALAFSPDGKTILSSDDDRTVRFWDPITGE